MSSAAARARSPIERLWQKPSGPGRVLWTALTPAALLYARALVLRERWWRHHCQFAPGPVISVGNLTVGGSGKTPFTLFLASRLAERGLRVAIVSRGWGRANDDGKPLLVADGRRIFASPREAGDEPVMLARSFAGPIAVARRRIDAIRLLAARDHLEVFVMDDGYQHLRLHRDLNLLLINAARGFGNGWVLPAGPLREPPGALARADAIIMISPAGAPHPDAMAGVSPPAGVAVLGARLGPHSLVRPENGQWREAPLELAGRRVVAVSGLADASAFHAMLRGLGAEIVAALDFPDHHDYTPADFETALATARGADLVITTEKDLVKLERFPAPGLPLCALRLQVDMNPADLASLFALIARKIPNLARC